MVYNASVWYHSCEIFVWKKKKKSFHDVTPQIYNELNICVQKIISSIPTSDGIQSEQHWIWPFDWRRNPLFGMNWPICFWSHHVSNFALKGWKINEILHFFNVRLEAYNFFTFMRTLSIWKWVHHRTLFDLKMVKYLMVP